MTLPATVTGNSPVEQNVRYIDDWSLTPQLGWTVLAPVGDVPAGWALAGTAVSRVTYADLFRKIGVSAGPGDGVSTFDLPDPGPSPTSALAWIVRVK